MPLVSYTWDMVTRIGPRRPARYYVKEWRVHRGLTLQQVADRIGVQENTIWRWENEPHRLNPGKIQALVEALDLQSGDSLTRVPGDRPSLDAMLKDTPDDVYQGVVELARRLARRG